MCKSEAQGMLSLSDYPPRLEQDLVPQTHVLSPTLTGNGLRAGTRSNAGEVSYWIRLPVRSTVAKPGWLPQGRPRPTDEEYAPCVPLPPGSPQAWPSAGITGCLNQWGCLLLDQEFSNHWLKSFKRMHRSQKTDERTAQAST